jgi:hypothetical protein
MPYYPFKRPYSSLLGPPIIQATHDDGLPLEQRGKRVKGDTIRHHSFDDIDENSDPGYELQKDWVGMDSEPESSPCKKGSRVSFAESPSIVIFRDEDSSQLTERSSQSESGDKSPKSKRKDKDGKPAANMAKTRVDPATVSGAKDDRRDSPKMSFDFESPHVFVPPIKFESKKIKLPNYTVRKTKVKADVTGDTPTESSPVWSDVISSSGKPDKKKKKKHKKRKDTSETPETRKLETTTAVSPEPVVERASSPLISEASSADAKTLKSINKRLKSIEARLHVLTSASATTVSSGTEEPDKQRLILHPTFTASELQSLRVEVSHLKSRIEANAIRSAVRHEILFTALTKVSADVNKLSATVASILERVAFPSTLQIQPTDDQESVESASETGTGAANGSVLTPNSAAKKTARSKEKMRAAMDQARKNMEQCLRMLNEDMNKAETAEEAEKFGQLCVRYAEDLFKTL